jgi:hypothetical protein
MSGGYWVQILRIPENPKLLARLSQDVRSKFRDPSQITGQSTAHLVYLDVAIHECTILMSSILILGLRRRPVANIAGLSSPRLTPPEGMTIAGHFISGNVLTICSKLT